MVEKYLTEYEKDRKAFQSNISRECWKCNSKNLQKVDLGIIVSKCKDCGSTTQYYTYKSWLSNIKSTSKHNIKSAKEAIRMLKLERQAKEREYNKNLLTQKERIQRARERIRSVR